MPAEGTTCVVISTPSTAEGVFMRYKRAVIFANGTLTDDAAAFELIKANDLLIAADGGARHMVRLGLKPQLLVGDMDSLEPQEVQALEQAGTEVRRFPVEKDETDLELALHEAHGLGCREIIVMAGMGGRMDQALGNLYLLLQPALVTADARLDDGCVEAFWVRHRAVLHGQPGEMVSLLPLLGPVEGIMTRGLRYPLHGETLFPEHTRGISNQMIDDEATVAAAQGLLLCIHERKRRVS
jgi:thiamine pyrophosphokinase